MLINDIIATNYVRKLGYYLSVRINSPSTIRVTAKILWFTGKLQPHYIEYAILLGGIETIFFASMRN
jgi:hypothetical protein